MSKGFVQGCVLFFFFFIGIFLIEGAEKPTFSAASTDGRLLISLPRIISFDPHPSIAEFQGDIAYRGSRVTGSVEFLEKWETKGENPCLKEIGFKIKLLKNGAEFQNFEFPLKQLETKKIKKGGMLAESKSGDLGVNIVLDHSQVIGKTLTGISFTVNLFDFGTEETSQLEETSVPPVPSTTMASSSTLPSPQTVGNVLEFAFRFSRKADALPDKNASTKIMLYKQALSVVPSSETSKEAQDFIQETTDKIASLKRGLPSGPRSVVASAPVASTGYSEKHVPSVEVKNLYDSAKKLFAKNQEPEARDLLRKALEKDPLFYEGWVLLGKNAFSNRKYSKAGEAFEKAVSLRDDDSDSGLYYFKSAYYLGETEKGLEKLIGMVKRYPQSNSSKIALGEAYFQAANLPLCEEMCVSIIQNDPENVQAKKLLERAREKMR
ncbi:tetratricopeptide repeat protein [bacterium]|nr:tetratricopeptide repeat protein [bacterium]